jgi:hypothetical protein
VTHEAHDVLSTRGRACDTHGEQCHFGSGGSDTKLFYPRSRTADQFCKLKLFIALAGEQLATFERFSNSIDDDSRSVAKNVRPHTHCVIDILIAVHIPDV